MPASYYVGTQNSFRTDRLPGIPAYLAVLGFRDACEAREKQAGAFKKCRAEV